MSIINLRELDENVWDTAVHETMRYCTARLVFQVY